MRYLPLILILFTTLAFAEPINKEYSYKAFPYHNLSFKSEPAKDFNNTEIIGSCFAQECLENQTPPFDIFPDGMTGVTFRKCNLVNILVPVGNIVENTSPNYKLKVQNDWEDWILDNSLKPVEPILKEMRVKAGISIDPKDIPEKKFTKEERDAFKENFNNISVNP